MATQVKQTCFLSAPYGQNIESLLRVLGDSGVDVMRLDNLVPGSEIPESVRAAVQEADFFVLFFLSGRAMPTFCSSWGSRLGWQRLSS